MTNIVIYIAPTIDTVLRQKIAETLRIRQIATTNNIQHATAIMHIQKNYHNH